MEKLTVSIPAPTEKPYDPYDTLKMQMETFNAGEGSLTGYECKICKNRGVIARIDNRERLVIGDCKCMTMRRCIRKMEQSGLKDTISKKTFDTFLAETPWQKRMKEIARNYAREPRGWLLFGGQSGSGKTHLCTAICREQLLQDKPVRYMPWREEIWSLKSGINDSERRNKLLEELRSAGFLYIDDLFKTGRSADGSTLPSSADISLAFEILNARYTAELPTVISTERTINELLEIDDAIAGRILEMAGGNALNIGRDSGKNYRLRNMISM